MALLGFNVIKIGKVIQMNQLDAVHIVSRCRSPSPCPSQQQDTICCKKSQSHAPDDGQNIARNMLS